MQTVRTKRNKEYPDVIDEILRITSINQQLNILFDKYKPKIVYSESVGTPVGKERKLAYIWGVFACLADKHKFQLIQINAKHVKKRITGFANAAKDDIKTKLIADLNLESKYLDQSEHAFDALAIAITGINENENGK